MKLAGSEEFVFFFGLLSFLVPEKPSAGRAGTVALGLKVNISKPGYASYFVSNTEEEANLQRIALIGARSRQPCCLCW